MKIMPISDSPMAPTGFGTNTRNIASIFASEGHEIGYAGCQNTEHTKGGPRKPQGCTKNPKRRPTVNAALV